MQEEDSSEALAMLVDSWKVVAVGVVGKEELLEGPETMTVDEMMYGELEGLETGNIVEGQKLHFERYSSDSESVRVTKQMEGEEEFER